MIKVVVKGEAGEASHGEASDKVEHKYLVIFCIVCTGLV